MLPLIVIFSCCFLFLCAFCCLMSLGAAYDDTSSQNFRVGCGHRTQGAITEAKAATWAGRKESPVHQWSNLFMAKLRRYFQQPILDALRRAAAGRLRNHKLSASAKRLVDPKKQWIKGTDFCITCNLQRLQTQNIRKWGLKLLHVPRPKKWS